MQIQTEERNVHVQYISVENYHNNVCECSESLMVYNVLAVRFS